MLEPTIKALALDFLWVMRLEDFRHKDGIVAIDVIQTNSLWLNLKQASERGGKLFVRVDEEAGRCYLQGGAVLVMAGVLLNTMQS